MIVHCLTFYCYDTYSYSGIQESEIKLFATQALALKQAKLLGLETVHDSTYIKNPATQCLYTIIPVETE